MAAPSEALNYGIAFFTTVILLILFAGFSMASPAPGMIIANLGELSVCFPFFLILALLFAALYAQGRSPLAFIDISGTRPKMWKKYRVRSWATMSYYERQAKKQLKAARGGRISRALNFLSRKGARRVYSANGKFMVDSKGRVFKLEGGKWVAATGKDIAGIRRAFGNRYSLGKRGTLIRKDSKGKFRAVNFKALKKRGERFHDKMDKKAKELSGKRGEAWRDLAKKKKAEFGDDRKGYFNWLRSSKAKSELDAKLKGMGLDKEPQLRTGVVTLGSIGGGLRGAALRKAVGADVGKFGDKERGEMTRRERMGQWFARRGAGYGKFLDSGGLSGFFLDRGGFIRHGGLIRRRKVLSRDESGKLRFFRKGSGSYHTKAKEAEQLQLLKEKRQEVLDELYGTDKKEGIISRVKRDALTTADKEFLNTLGSKKVEIDGKNYKLVDGNRFTYVGRKRIPLITIGKTVSADSSIKQLEKFAKNQSRNLGELSSRVQGAKTALNSQQQMKIQLAEMQRAGTLSGKAGADERSAYMGLYRHYDKHSELLAKQVGGLSGYKIFGATAKILLGETKSAFKKGYAEAKSQYSPQTRFEIAEMGYKASSKLAEDMARKKDVAVQRFQDRYVAHKLRKELGAEKAGKQLEKAKKVSPAVHAQVAEKRTQLEKDIAKDKSQINNLKSSVTAAENELKALRSQKKAGGVSVEDMDKKISSAKQGLATAETKLNQAQVRLKQNNADLESGKYVTSVYDKYAESKGLSRDVVALAQRDYLRDQKKLLESKRDAFTVADKSREHHFNKMNEYSNLASESFGKIQSWSQEASATAPSERKELANSLQKMADDSIRKSYLVPGDYGNAKKSLMNAKSEFMKKVDASKELAKEEKKQLKSNADEYFRHRGWELYENTQSAEAAQQSKEALAGAEGVDKLEDQISLASDQIGKLEDSLGISEERLAEVPATEFDKELMAAKNEWEAETEKSSKKGYDSSKVGQLEDEMRALQELRHTARNFDEQSNLYEMTQKQRDEAEKEYGEAQAAKEQYLTGTGSWNDSFRSGMDYSVIEADGQRSAYTQSKINQLQQKREQGEKPTFFDKFKATKLGGNLAYAANRFGEGAKTNFKVARDIGSAYKGFYAAEIERRKFRIAFGNTTKSERYWQAKARDTNVRLGSEEAGGGGWRGELYESKQVRSELTGGENTVPVVTVKDKETGKEKEVKVDLYKPAFRDYVWKDEEGNTYKDTEVEFKGAAGPQTFEVPTGVVTVADQRTGQEKNVPVQMENGVWTDASRSLGTVSLADKETGEKKSVSVQFVNGSWVDQEKNQYSPESVRPRTFDASEVQIVSEPQVAAREVTFAGEGTAAELEARGMPARKSMQQLSSELEQARKDYNSVNKQLIPVDVALAFLESEKVPKDASADELIDFVKNPANAQVVREVMHAYRKKIKMDKVTPTNMKFVRKSVENALNAAKSEIKPGERQDASSLATALQKKRTEFTKALLKLGEAKAKSESQLQGAFKDYFINEKRIKKIEKGIEKNERVLAKANFELQKHRMGELQGTIEGYEEQIAKFQKMAESPAAISSDKKRFQELTNLAKKRKAEAEKELKELEARFRLHSAGLSLAEADKRLAKVFSEWYDAVKERAEVERDARQKDKQPDADRMNELNAKVKEMEQEIEEAESEQNGLYKVTRETANAWVWGAGTSTKILNTSDAKRKRLDSIQKSILGSYKDAREMIGKIEKGEQVSDADYKKVEKKIGNLVGQRASIFAEARPAAPEERARRVEELSNDMVGQAQAIDRKRHALAAETSKLKELVASNVAEGDKIRAMSDEQFSEELAESKDAWSKSIDTFEEAYASLSSLEKDLEDLSAGLKEMRSVHNYLLQYDYFESSGWLSSLRMKATRAFGKDTGRPLRTREKIGTALSYGAPSTAATGLGIAAVASVAVPPAAILLGAGSLATAWVSSNAIKGRHPLVAAGTPIGRASSYAAGRAKGRYKTAKIWDMQEFKSIRPSQATTLGLTMRGFSKDPVKAEKQYINLCKSLTARNATAHAMSVGIGIETQLSVNTPDRVKILRDMLEYNSIKQVLKDRLNAQEGEIEAAVRAFSKLEGAGSARTLNFSSISEALLGLNEKSLSNPKERAKAKKRLTETLDNLLISSSHTLVHPNKEAILSALVKAKLVKNDKAAKKLDDIQILEKMAELNRNEFTELGEEIDEAKLYVFSIKKLEDVSGKLKAAEKAGWDQKSISDLSAWSAKAGGAFYSLSISSLNGMDLFKELAEKHVLYEKTNKQIDELLSQYDQAYMDHHLMVVHELESLFTRSDALYGMAFNRSVEAGRELDELRFSGATGRSVNKRIKELSEKKAQADLVMQREGNSLLFDYSAEVMQKALAHGAQIKSFEELQNALKNPELRRRTLQKYMPKEAVDQLVLAYRLKQDAKKGKGKPDERLIAILTNPKSQDWKDYHAALEPILGNLSIAEDVDRANKLKDLGNKFKDIMEQVKESPGVSIGALVTKSLSKEEKELMLNVIQEASEDEVDKALFEKPGALERKITELGVDTVRDKLFEEANRELAEVSEVIGKDALAKYKIAQEQLTVLEPVQSAVLNDDFSGLTASDKLALRKLKTEVGEQYLERALGSKGKAPDAEFVEEAAKELEQAFRQSSIGEKEPSEKSHYAEVASGLREAAEKIRSGKLSRDELLKKYGDIIRSLPNEMYMIRQSLVEKKEAAIVEDKFTFSEMNKFFEKDYNPLKEQVKDALGKSVSRYHKAIGETEQKAGRARMAKLASYMGLVQAIEDIEKKPAGTAAEQKAQKQEVASKIASFLRDNKAFAADIGFGVSERKQFEKKLSGDEEFSRKDIDKMFYYVKTTQGKIMGFDTPEGRYVEGEVVRNVKRKLEERTEYTTKFFEGYMKALQFKNVDMLPPDLDKRFDFADAQIARNLERLKTARTPGEQHRYAKEVELLYHSVYKLTQEMDYRVMKQRVSYGAADSKTRAQIDRLERLYPEFKMRYQVREKFANARRQAARDAAHPWDVNKAFKSSKQRLSEEVFNYNSRFQQLNSPTPEGKAFRKYMRNRKILGAAGFAATLGGIGSLFLAGPQVGIPLTASGVLMMRKALKDSFGAMEEAERESCTMNDPFYWNMTVYQQFNESLSPRGANKFGKIQENNMITGQRNFTRPFRVLRDYPKSATKRAFAPVSAMNRWDVGKGAALASKYSRIEEVRNPFVRLRYKTTKAWSGYKSAEDYRVNYIKKKIEKKRKGATPQELRRHDISTRIDLKPLPDQAPIYSQHYGSAIHVKNPITNPFFRPIKQLGDAIFNPLTSKMIHGYATRKASLGQQGFWEEYMWPQNYGPYIDPRMGFFAPRQWMVLTKLTKFNPYLSRSMSPHKALIRNSTILPLGGYNEWMLAALGAARYHIGPEGKYNPLGRLEEPPNAARVVMEAFRYEDGTANAPMLNRAVDVNTAERSDHELVMSALQVYKEEACLQSQLAIAREWEDQEEISMIQDELKRKVQQRHNIVSQFKTGQEFRDYVTAMLNEKKMDSPFPSAELPQATPEEMRHMAAEERERLEELLNEPIMPPPAGGSAVYDRERKEHGREVSQRDLLMEAYTAQAGMLEKLDKSRPAGAEPTAEMAAGMAPAEFVSTYRETYSDLLSEGKTEDELNFVEQSMRVAYEGVAATDSLAALSAEVDKLGEIYASKRPVSELIAQVQLCNEMLYELGGEMSDLQNSSDVLAQKLMEEIDAGTPMEGLEGEKKIVLRNWALAEQLERKKDELRAEYERVEDEALGTLSAEQRTMLVNARRFELDREVKRVNASLLQHSSKYQEYQEEVDRLSFERDKQVEYDEKDLRSNLYRLLGVQQLHDAYNYQRRVIRSRVVKDKVERKRELSEKPLTITEAEEKEVLEREIDDRLRAVDDYFDCLISGRKPEESKKIGAELLNEIEGALDDSGLREGVQSLASKITYEVEPNLQSQFGALAYEFVRQDSDGEIGNWMVTDDGIVKGRDQLAGEVAKSLAILYNSGRKDIVAKIAAKDKATIQVIRAAANMNSELLSRKNADPSFVLAKGIVNTDTGRLDTRSPYETRNAVAPKMDYEARDGSYTLKTTGAGGLTYVSRELDEQGAAKLDENGKPIVDQYIRKDDQGNVQDALAKFEIKKDESGRVPEQLASLEGGYLQFKNGEYKVFDSSGAEIKETRPEYKTALFLGVNSLNKLSYEARETQGAVSQAFPQAITSGSVIATSPEGKTVGVKQQRIRVDRAEIEKEMMEMRKRQVGDMLVKGRKRSKDRVKFASYSDYVNSINRDYMRELEGLRAKIQSNGGALSKKDYVRMAALSEVLLGRPLNAFLAEQKAIGTNTSLAYGGISVQQDFGNDRITITQKRLFASAEANSKVVSMAFEAIDYLVEARRAEKKAEADAFIDNEFVKSYEEDLVSKGFMESTSPLVEGKSQMLSNAKDAMRIKMYEQADAWAEEFGARLKGRVLSDACVMGAVGWVQGKKGFQESRLESALSTREKTLTQMKEDAAYVKSFQGALLKSAAADALMVEEQMKDQTRRELAEKQAQLRREEMAVSRLQDQVNMLRERLLGIETPDDLFAGGEEFSPFPIEERFNIRDDKLDELQEKIPKVAEEVSETRNAIIDGLDAMLVEPGELTEEEKAGYKASLEGKLNILSTLQESLSSMAYDYWEALEIVALEHIRKDEDEVLAGLLSTSDKQGWLNQELYSYLGAAVDRENATVKITKDLASLDSARLQELKKKEEEE